MEQIKQLFLNILNAALRGERYTPREEVTSQQWQQILEMAQIHKVLPMVFEAVYHLPGLAEIQLPYRQQVMRQVFLQTAKTGEFLKLYRHLRSAGVKALVVKGIICRELYDQPDYRASSDEDVLIPPEQFPLCHEAMVSFGMETAEDPDHFDAKYEIPYGKPGSPLYIELHKHLFPPQSAAYGDLNRLFAGVFDRAEQVEVQGVGVYTMAPADHLFYLICHAFKHFIHSGFGIRQVCDICMFANRYGSRINWEQVLCSCRRIRADQFAAAILRIGENYLNFDPVLACLPDCWQEIRVDETAMLEDLLQSGIYGDSELSRKQSSTITLSAVENQKRGTEKPGWVATLFPSADALEGRYPYLKKRPYLLIAAWASRILTYGVKNAGTDHAARSLRIGNARIALMKQYGILEE